MANQKLTKKDYFNMILALNEVKTNEELTTFVEHEIELLEKKNATRKPTKTQVENDTIKANILNGMDLDKLYTVTDLMNQIPELDGLSNQKVSALVTQLKNEGALIKVEEKRKSYFKLA